MEPEHREDHADVEPQTSERSDSSTGQAALTTPLASEGLEQLRDSHC